MIDFPALRREFPALDAARERGFPVFLDGPAGTQVPQQVIDAVARYYTECNANHGGAFTTSRESDRLLDEAHRTLADFLNAPSPDEIAFGQNMTSLTFHLSRSIAKSLRPGDEVMATRLDHDANVAPWVLAARDAGATVRWVDVRSEDCTLELETFARQLSEKTRLVAVGLASNAVGTVNDVAAIARRAKAAGALVFVDAVHFAPHGPIDVQALGCDFLACSAYKFFGPHVGVLWGKRKLLEQLPAYKVRPAPETLPGRWMTGTQNHEGIAGTAAAVEYLADIGSQLAPDAPRRERLVRAMTAIREYERGLSRRLLEGLAERPRFRVLGIRDPGRVAERVPTVSFTCKDATPRQVAEHLARREIYAWDGNVYALELCERLGLGDCGFVRLGAVHYNTAEEIDQVLRALDELPAG